MEPFNILTTQFVPVSCKDAPDVFISLRELSVTDDGHEPMSTGFAEPFLNRAFLEMTIGILQVMCPPETDSEWAKRRATGFSPEEFDSIFAPFVSFFSLYGKQPAFQISAAQEDPRSKKWPVGRLVRDVTGTPRTMGLAAAAVALYGLQSHAHSGGRGYGVSLSAGGPIRTIPDMPGTLFTKAWDSVINRAEFEKLGTPTIVKEELFPWCLPPRNSASSADSPASTLYFALPRRLLLTPPSHEGECAYGGGYGPLISMVYEGPDGTKYPPEHWKHPMTPYRVDASRGWVPVRANTYISGVTWKDRVGLLQKSVDKKGEPSSEPALVISIAQSRMSIMISRIGGIMPVVAYGHKYDNAKYNGPLYSMQPLSAVSSNARTAYEGDLKNGVDAGVLVQNALRNALTSAQLTDGQTDNENSRNALKSRVDSQAASFWSRTTDKWEEFDAASVKSREAEDDEAADAAAETLLLNLGLEAMRLFDEYVPDPISEGIMSYSLARKSLSFISKNTKVRAAMNLPILEQENKIKEGNAE